MSTNKSPFSKTITSNGQLYVHENNNLDDFSQSLLNRSLFGIQDSSFNDIYSCKYFIENLDLSSEVFGSRTSVNSINWNNNGDLIASGGNDGNIRVFSFYQEYAFEMINRCEINNNKNKVTSVMFYPENENTLIAAMDDGVIRLFDLNKLSKNNNQPVRVLCPFEESSFKIIKDWMNPHSIIACSLDGTVRICDFRTPINSFNSQNLNSYLNKCDIIKPTNFLSLVDFSKKNIPITFIDNSPLSPHYLATSARSKYIYLHDRRMNSSLIRDYWNVYTPHYLTQSTCVRKFSPNLGYGNSSSSVKFNPNNTTELLGSWNSENIYLFDINKDPEEFKSLKNIHIYDTNNFYGSSIPKNLNFSSIDPNLNKFTSFYNYRFKTESKNKFAYQRETIGRHFDQFMSLLRLVISFKPHLESFKISLKRIHNNIVFPTKLLREFDFFSRAFDSLWVIDKEVEAYQIYFLLANYVIMHLCNPPIPDGSTSTSPVDQDLIEYRASTDSASEYLAQLNNIETILETKIFLSLQNSSLLPLLADAELVYILVPLISRINASSELARQRYEKSRLNHKHIIEPLINRLENEPVENINGEFRSSVSNFDDFYAFNNIHSSEYLKHVPVHHLQKIISMLILQKLDPANIAIVNGLQSGLTITKYSTNEKPLNDLSTENSFFNKKSSIFSPKIPIPSPSFVYITTHPLAIKLGVRDILLSERAKLYYLSKSFKEKSNLKTYANTQEKPHILDFSQTKPPLFSSGSGLRFVKDINMDYNTAPIEIDIMEDVSIESPSLDTTGTTQTVNDTNNISDSLSDLGMSSIRSNTLDSQSITDIKVNTSCTASHSKDFHFKNSMNLINSSWNPNELGKPSNIIGSLMVHIASKYILATREFGISKRYLSSIDEFDAKNDNLYEFDSLEECKLKLLKTEENPITNNTDEEESIKIMNINDYADDLASRIDNYECDFDKFDCYKEDNIFTKDMIRDNNYYVNEFLKGLNINNENELDDSFSQNIFFIKEIRNIKKNDDSNDIYREYEVNKIKILKLLNENVLNSIMDGFLKGYFTFDSNAPEEDKIWVELGLSNERENIFSLEQNAPCINPSGMYTGHYDSELSRQINFFGKNGEYIVSGSDDGNVFIWNKKDSQIEMILKGDLRRVTSIEPHPLLPILAVAGMDATIKIYSSEGIFCESESYEKIPSPQGNPVSTPMARRNHALNRVTTGHLRPAYNAFYSTPEMRNGKWHLGPSLQVLDNIYRITANNELSRKRGAHAIRNRYDLLQQFGLGGQSRSSLLSGSTNSDCTVM